MSKLLTFSKFVDTLLPHETAFLLSQQQFVDPDRLEILKIIDHNSQELSDKKTFNQNIDRRKYSHLKQWIQRQLARIDVDLQLEWIMQLQKKIISDSLLPKDEHEIFKSIKSYRPDDYYFLQYVNMLTAYAEYLLIRMQTAEYSVIKNYLRDYEKEILLSQNTNQKIQSITEDVILGKAIMEHSEHWKREMWEIFHQIGLDGLTRQKALTRLIAISLNSKELDYLFDVFDHLDDLFLQGKMYSKRLLLNYYSNKMQLLAAIKQWKAATYFGFLSIRSTSSDHLLYVNNLATVLIHQKKIEEAYTLLQNHALEASHSNNFHNHIQYVANYIHSTHLKGLFKQGEHYARTFLKAYDQNIFKYRWQAFILYYYFLLLDQNKYEQITAIYERYGLREKLEYESGDAPAIPSIQWIYALSKYILGEMDQAKFSDIIQQYTKTIQGNIKLEGQVQKLLLRLRPHAAKLINQIISDHSFQKRVFVH